MAECKHRRIKKNFPHGRKSKPVRECKDCGEPIKMLELKKDKKFNKNKPNREREEYPEKHKEEQF